MTCCRWFPILAGAIIVFGLTRSAHANSLSPYIWFWPGVVSLSLIYAFPASLLAAFAERPFVTRAGFDRRALVLSLRANFFSTVVGLLLLPVGMPALYTIGPLWCVAAFAISCTVEVLCLRQFNRELAKGSIIAGNAVSSGLLMILPPIAFELRTSYYFLARVMEPHEVWLAWTATLASLAVFLLSFAFPVRAMDVAEKMDLGRSDTAIGENQEPEPSMRPEPDVVAARG